MSKVGEISKIDARIPVTILTGFLGAGKTTLLNYLIEEFPEKKIAVIENEFGEINIDRELIVDNGNPIYELSNGCICCTLNDDLVNVLYDLLASGKTFNHLIIETTGIADPGAVALNFITDYGVQQQYRLDGIVALVDAVNVLTQLGENEEISKQLAVADAVVLNKISEVSAEYLVEVKAVVRKINPLAPMASCDFARPKGISLLSLKAFSASYVLATNFEGYTRPPILKGEVKSTHTDITSVSIIHEGAINPIIFDNWVTVLLFSSSIYRIKGVLSMATYDSKFIFQAVGSQFVSELGPDWGTEPRVNRLVFIGKNLKEQLLREGFEKCLVS